MTAKEQTHVRQLRYSSLFMIRAANTALPFLANDRGARAASSFPRFTAAAS